jgi:RNA polymerase sigma factor for flagellar operon FliA
MSTIDLWTEYVKTRDKKLKDRLIVEYIRFVKIIAGRLFSNYGNNVEFDDLVSYGIFGLIDAIDRFDPSKNVKFETYASIRIRGAIIDHLRTLDWIPRSIRQKYKTIEDAYKFIEDKLGRSAKDEEVAQELGISLKEFNSMLSEIHAFSVISLEDKLSNNLNFTIIDKDEDHEPEKYFAQKEIKTILLEAIETLSERDKKIISLYYYNELTYKEISCILGISESRISQLHTKIIIKLKNKLDKLL